jgi:hypothetical protein
VSPTALELQDAARAAGDIASEAMFGPLIAAETGGWLILAAGFTPKAGLLAPAPG